MIIKIIFQCRIPRNLAVTRVSMSRRARRIAADRHGGDVAVAVAVAGEETVAEIVNRAGTGVVEGGSA